MQLRPAIPGDELDVARVHVRSWQVGYRSLMPGDYLDSLRPEDRAARYSFAHLDPALPFTMVAVDTGRILGFATTGPAFAAEYAGWGELYALYVDPEFFGQGFGAALLAAARTRLVELGFRDALLWVLTANIRARRFYDRDGWENAGVRRLDQIWGIDVDSICYQRRLIAGDRHS